MEFQNFDRKSRNLTTVGGGSGGEIYTVFDEESESEAENLEILQPDLEKRNFKILKKIEKINDY